MTQLLPQLAIGIYMDANHTREQLSDSVYSLLANTASLSHFTIKVFVLCPHVDSQLQRFIEQSAYTLISLNDPFVGRVYYFNELINRSTDYFLFLDCGVWLEPEGLEAMITVMTSQPQTGMVGPSSNNGWNQQSLYKDAYPKSVDITRRRHQVLKKYDGEMQQLETLQEHCFVVAKSVVDCIGFADLNYKNGYCWEVDYQKKAQLHGFNCQWVKGVYAHQRDLVDCQQRTRTFSQNVRFLNRKYNQPNDTDRQYQKYEKPSLKHHTALISCIMPTANRPDYVAQSIDYFKRQTYSNTELIIVYECDSDLPKGEWQQSNIYLVKAKPESSIGHKRNTALAFACGDIIAHWDDDDWYASTRLSEQAAPLLKGEADISGLYHTVFFQPAAWRAWTVSDQLYQQMFVQGVHGGTLMYLSALVGETSFHDISLREDAIFLEAMLDKGARLSRCDGFRLFAYLRHGENSWRFNRGLFSNKHELFELDIVSVMGDDILFYQGFYNSSQKRASVLNTKQPLVSCIMPTGNRPELARLAIRYFLRQDYVNKELIIIDDGTQYIEGILPEQEKAIKYITLAKKHTIGQKRNLAIEHANGDIILHFDDDDWIARTWLTTQVQALLASDSDVVGIRNAYYFNPAAKQAWKYSYPLTDKAWVLGGSLCYWKKFWQRNKFANMNTGEDATFLWSKQSKKIAVHDDEQLYIGIIHADNTSPKITSGSNWTEINSAEIREMMGHDYQYYCRNRFAAPSNFT